MTNNDVLYLKGMHLSESEQDIDEEEEDVWDDHKLNNAYAKAMRTANEEVAKRIAMSTNTKTCYKEDTNKNKNDSPKPHATKSSNKKEQIQWKTGMHCRAVYNDDGEEYEAFLLSMIDDKTCVVKYIGYNNTETVEISSLKPSLGHVERTRQIEASLLDKTEVGSEASNMECSDRAFSVASSDTIPKRKKSGKKKKSKPKPTNNFSLPDMPMPDFAHLGHMGPMDMPFPPPPPSLRPTDNEEQTVSSMLLSWYMSGYYTGLYQGMRRTKSERK